MPLSSDHSSNRAEQQAAADWVARRDRGLSAAEQDDYLQWLRDDPRRAAMIARHEETVRRLQGLSRWQPACSSEPNPDLFARPKRRWWRGVAAMSALAAALVIGALVWRTPPARTPPPRAAETAKSFLRVNERQVLADGSVVELRDGSTVVPAFTKAERRVRLTGGEAHFTVAPNAAWPFVVEAGKVVVRAVGTAFVVRLEPTLVDVVVTEGKVRLEPPAAPNRTVVEQPIVAAHERVVLSFAGDAVPRVSTVSAEQMQDALAWKAPRFQFDETPLADAVAAFNRHNAQQLRIADPALGRKPIGGTFRADNVEGFVNLLELTLGVSAERTREGPIVLRRPR